MASEIDVNDPEHTKHITLDRSRHVGTVFPPENGAVHFQDGLLFKNDGTLALDAMDGPALKRLEKAIVRRKADIAAEEAKRAVYAKLGIDPAELEGMSAGEFIAKTAEVNPGDINLVAWAKGETKYQWFQVRAAAKEQYGIALNSEDGKKHLIDRMVEMGKVSRSDSLIA